MPGYPGEPGIPGKDGESGQPGVPGVKGQKGETIGLDKLEEKIEGGIKSLQSQLQDCCNKNQHRGKRYTPHDTVTCPPHGKVYFDL